MTGPTPEEAALVERAKRMDATAKALDALMPDEPPADPLDDIQAEIDAAQLHYEDELAELIEAAARQGRELEPPEVHMGTEHVLNALDGLVRYLRTLRPAAVIDRGEQP